MMESKRAKVMLAYLPRYYETSRVMQLGVLQPAGSELDKLRQALNEILDQNFIERATWGLARWESQLGITPLPTDTDEDRRRRILVQMIWQATSTKPFMEDLINRYTVRNTGRVIDHPQSNSFETIFDIDDVRDYRAMCKAVQLYKPAHLMHVFSGSIRSAPRPSQIATILLAIEGRQNFWNRSATVYRWNGLYAWDGSIPWGYGQVREQGHDVRIFSVLGAKKAFTEAAQQWNGGFKWDGTRKWGAFAPSDQACNHAVKMVTIVSGTPTGREIL